MKLSQAVEENDLSTVACFFYNVMHGNARLRSCLVDFFDEEAGVPDVVLSFLTPKSQLGRKTKPKTIDKYWELVARAGELHHNEIFFLMFQNLTKSSFDASKAIPKIVKAKNWEALKVLLPIQKNRHLFETRVYIAKSSDLEGLKMYLEFLKAKDAPLLREALKFFAHRCWTGRKWKLLEYLVTDWNIKTHDLVNNFMQTSWRLWWHSTKDTGIFREVVHLPGFDLHAPYTRSTDLWRKAPGHPGFPSDDCEGIPKTIFGVAATYRCCGMVKEMLAHPKFDITAERNVFCTIACYREGFAYWHTQGSNPAAKSLMQTLAQAFDIDWRDETGRAAIHYAAVRGNPSVLRLLLEAGADPDLKFEGRTPLEMALEFRYADYEGQKVKTTVHWELIWLLATSPTNTDPRIPEKYGEELKEATQVLYIPSGPPNSFWKCDRSRFEDTFTRYNQCSKELFDLFQKQQKRRPQMVQNLACFNIT